MPAPTDAVMPILRRIQEDLAETRRELGRKIDSHSEKRIRSKVIWSTSLG